MRYAVQAMTFPPTFAFWVNDKDLVHWSYERFLENAIRSRHSFEGTPIRLVFNQNRANPKLDKKKTKARTRAEIVAKGMIKDVKLAGTPRRSGSYYQF